MDVSGVQNTQSSSISDGLKLNQDFDQFLRLLTTQLKNQDPLSPMDSTEFTNQLVQFSGVEQSIKTNSLLESLLTTQTLNMTALGVSFIGKGVEVAGTRFQNGGGASSVLSYSLPLAAESGTLSILDEDGNTVYSRNIETEAGRHEFVWDGKNSDGNPVPAGKYQLKVVATGVEKEAINVSTFVPGHVRALESDEYGNLMLDIDGEKIPLTDVRKILEPSA